VAETDTENNHPMEERDEAEEEGEQKGEQRGHAGELEQQGGPGLHTGSMKANEHEIAAGT
jgi:hypothetical protein